MFEGKERGGGKEIDGGEAQLQVLAARYYAL
jgi:hypothetical protein